MCTVYRYALISGSTPNRILDPQLRKHRVSTLLAKKIGISWVVASILLSVFVSYAIASTITVSTTTYQQILGGYINSTGGLTAPDSGLSTPALPTSPTGPPSPPPS